MSKLKSALCVITCATAFASASASALTITPVTNAATAGADLQAALLAPDSGITVVGSATYQGNTTVPQSGTYSGFNLAPSSGSTPTLALPDGIFLTSGGANIPLTNTVDDYTNVTGSGSHPLLSTLAGTTTRDANALTFSFTTAPGQTSVSAQFVFGTDEFPTQSVTDIFGFFVDGVNYAHFPSGELISNTPGSPTNFITNPVGGDLYGIEYNGLTNVFTVTALLNMALEVHTLTIAIADTSDSSWDSGVFIGAVKAGTATSGGIGDGTVPEPGSVALLGLGMLGLLAARRRKQ